LLQIIKKKWKLISDFNRNVFTLFSGVTIAQAIPVFISPILTRIYSPQDFGILSLFLAFSMIIASLSSGRYEFAIILPKDDAHAVNIAALAIFISLIFSIFIFCLITLFHDLIITTLKDENIAIWLYFVPFASFLISLFNILNYLKIRDKKYKDISCVKIVRSIFSGSIQLLIGLLEASPLGLIFGNIGSYITSNLLLCRKLTSKASISKISFLGIKNQAIRYVRFPKFTLPGELCNALSLNLINIFITTLFSISILGLYSLINRIMIAPLNLIGNSIGQVYYKEAALEKINTGNNISILLATIKKLIIVSIPVFIILYIYIDEIIPFLFGRNWSIAGKYARILIPLFAVRFIVSPITVTLNVLEKQSLLFYWQFEYLFSVIIVFIISYQLTLSIEQFLQLYTWNSIFQYLIIFILVLKITLKRSY